MWWCFFPLVQYIANIGVAAKINMFSNNVQTLSVNKYKYLQNETCLCFAKQFQFLNPWPSLKIIPAQFSHLPCNTISCFYKYIAVTGIINSLNI